MLIENEITKVWEVPTKNANVRIHGHMKGTIKAAVTKLFSSK